MKRFLWVSLLILVGWSPPRAADAQVVTLGNVAPGFNDGDSVDIFQLIAAQAGQPAPFDQGYGSDPVSNFNQSWTFNYAAPGSFNTATVEIGIVDDDSGSTGSQLASFLLDGNSLTLDLDALMTSGASGQYRVYSVNIPNALFAALNDGSATFALALQGPVQNPDLFGGPPVTESFNGANLIYSRLSFTTAAVPEPSPLILAGAASVVGLVSLRLRGAKGRG